jgi:hypothetical protein
LKADNQIAFAYSQDLVGLEKVKATGGEEAPSFISKDIENICDRKAETFEEYLLGRDEMTTVERGADPELKPLVDVPAASA